MIQTITIQGGLTAGVADIAHFGDVQIERLPDETVEAFEQRAHDLAIAAGASTLVIGGLPKMKFEETNKPN
jgi:DNA polymerase III sliding clamp (beta) subunit (PCNA family)